MPTPQKVICCGLNFSDHIQEMGRELPQHPTLFAKYADTLIGPYDDIVLPPGHQVDWEAELAVVVGAELRGATPDEARDGLAGYTVANDISVRDWQNRTLQWFQGKAWDATTPVGPVTGTPGGVGQGMNPPAFLHDGDVVETEIPGIGCLRNVIRNTF